MQSVERIEFVDCANASMSCSPTYLVRDALGHQCVGRASRKARLLIEIDPPVERGLNERCEQAATLVGKGTIPARIRDCWQIGRLRPRQAPNQFIDFGRE
jgi:hypothetical protein